MGIPKEIDEGKFYRLLQAALRMRQLQKNKKSTSMYDAVVAHNAEIIFDGLLDGILGEVDKIDTDRVINKMNGL